MEIKIGTKYIARNKRKDECEVIDIYTTTNSKGEIVKTEYLCQHMFMGQVVKHLEVATTIQIALFREQEAA